jgi:type II secretory pathway component GspD/PulD (secretin)
VTLSTDGLTGAGSIGVDVANEANRGFDNSTANTRTRTSSNNFNNTSTTTGTGTTFSNTSTSTGLDSAFSQSVANTFDIYNSLRGYNAGLGGGFTATLQPDDVSFAIEAFMTDSDTTLTQYPRVLTVNNREVAISNARNQPILGSSSQNNSSGSSTTASEVQYLPIGTQVNILPKTMPDGSVFLNVAITISSRGDDIFLPAGPNGEPSPYPITFSRVYQAALQVDSGYTLAVGGLEEATDFKSSNGIIGLQSIPGIGSLFKSSGRNLDKRNLIVFITPTIINDRRSTGGITEVPESVIPIRPGDPTPPAFGTDGRLAGGYTGLDGAFAWLAFQNRFFEQLLRESRVTNSSIQQLEGVIRTAEMVLAEIEYLATRSPARMQQFAKKEEEALSLLNQLQDTLKRSKEDLF